MPLARLEALLAEAPHMARARALAAFPMARGDRPVVLVGAGSLGQRAAAAMRAAGDLPIAFADSSEALHGSIVESVAVEPLDVVARRHPRAAYVVTIWGASSAHRIRDTHRLLGSLGVSCIIPFAHLFWHYTTALPHYLVDLPHHLLDAREAVRSAYDLWSDALSRAEFVSQVEARLTGDVSHLAPPVAAPQYFAPGIVAERAGEVVVDGGAFDGDTLRAWRASRGDSFTSWTAFEPHPESAARFEATAASLPRDVSMRVQLYRLALGAGAGTVRFPRQPSPGAAPVTSTDTALTVPVTVAALDDMPLPGAPSFIKLDIEGAELDALAGMRTTVQRHRPVLAVCAYHRQAHLWQVPLAIAAMRDDDAFLLRPHGAEGWDLVCYAVPRERRVA